MRSSIAGRAAAALLATLGLLAAAAAPGAVVPAQAADDPTVVVVTGRLLDPGGRPVRDVSVVQEGAETDPVRTDDEGRFRVTVEPGERLLLAGTPGEGTTFHRLQMSGTVPVTTSGGALDLGDLSTPALAPTRVRVLLPDGSSPSRAEVSADTVVAPWGELLGEGLEDPTGSVATRGSGDAGVVDVVRLASDESPAFSVTATRDGGNIWRASIPAGAHRVVDDDVEVRIPPHPVVSGRLLDAAGGPATGHRVGTEFGASSSVVDEVGSFSFPTSKWSSRPSIDVGTDWRRGRFVLVGSVLDVTDDVDLGTLTLPPVPDLRLQVVNEHGEALPYAELDGDFDRRLSDLLGHRLGDGQQVERITYLLNGRTDDHGRFTGLLPTGRGGGLTGFDVSYTDGVGSFSATAEDAVPLADGSYRITLDGATVAPAPDPPTRFRATAADGAVLLTWRPNPAAVPGRWHTVITSYPSGTETTLDPGESRRVMRVPNGSARSYTIASDDGVARSRDLVRTPEVTPQALSITAGVDPRRARGILLDRVARFGHEISLPGAHRSCRVDGRLVLGGCDLEGATVRDAGPGTHVLEVGVYDALVSSAVLRWEFTVPHGPRTLADRGWDLVGDGRYGPRSYVEATARGATARTRAPATTSVSLVARTGPGQGVLRVGGDGGPSTRVDLAALPASERDLVTVPVDRQVRGVLEIEVVSRHRPVRLWGVATTP